jgi:hypothetical protein
VSNPRRYLPIIIVSFLLLAAGIAIGTHSATAGPLPEQIAEQSNQSSESGLLGLSPDEAPPPPETDTCQHCHLSGAIESLFAPLLRWTLFGMAGLAFVYGAYRTGSVIVTRKPWKPLAARATEWFDERFQIVEPIRKFLAKPVPKFATKWWYCLGGITFALFLIQGITGIMLAFYYKPSVQEAYASIQFIENEVLFGSAIRSIHHWCANGMVVMAVAHMIRVFITGAFKPPRELNWVSGVSLGLLTLVFGFTGYLLAWDQRAFWATTVGSEIAGGIPVVGDILMIFLRGGWQVGDIALSRFFAMHILALPVLIVIFLGMHFLMVRRQGIARPL